MFQNVCSNESTSIYIYIYIYIRLCYPSCMVFPDVIPNWYGYRNATQKQCCRNWIAHRIVPDCGPNLTLSDTIYIYIYRYIYNYIYLYICIPMYIYLFDITYTFSKWKKIYGEPSWEFQKIKCHPLAIYSLASVSSPASRTMQRKFHRRWLASNTEVLSATSPNYIGMSGFWEFHLALPNIPWLLNYIYIYIHIKSGNSQPTCYIRYLCYQICTQDSLLSYVYIWIKFIWKSRKTNMYIYIYMYIESKNQRF